MRLHDRRVRLERALRAVGLLAGVWLIVGSRSNTPPVNRLDIDGSAATIGTWIQGEADTLAIVESGLPVPEARAALQAIRRFGQAVEWGAGRIDPTAVEVVSVPDPRGGSVIRIAAPGQMTIRIEDGIGLGDTTVAGGAGAALQMPPLLDSAVVSTSNSRASAPIADALPLGRVAVYGRAGWESKFAIQALEERGWEIDAMLSVAPGVSVDQGQPRSVDTASHAVVVVLDSIEGLPVQAITQFVRNGGGLVLGPGAVTVPALGRLAPALLGEYRRPAQVGFVSARPLESLAYHRLDRRADAVALTRLDGEVTMAARREQLGRVVMLGYEDTWRWRLLGDAGVNEHRLWWSNLLTSVASSRSVSRQTPNAAPFAQTVAALGQPVDGVREAGGRRGVLWPWLLGLMLLGMFGEWTSRRLAGVA